jgi:hypothetical protein
MNAEFDVPLESVTTFLWWVLLKILAAWDP